MSWSQRRVESYGQLCSLIHLRSYSARRLTPAASFFDFRQAMAVSGFRQIGCRASGSSLWAWHREIAY